MNLTPCFSDCDLTDLLYLLKLFQDPTGITFRGGWSIEAGEVANAVGLKGKRCYQNLPPTFPTTTLIANSSADLSWNSCKLKPLALSRDEEQATGAALSAHTGPSEDTKRLCTNFSHILPKHSKSSPLK